MAAHDLLPGVEKRLVFMSAVASLYRRFFLGKNKKVFGASADYLLVFTQKETSRVQLKLM